MMNRRRFLAGLGLGAATPMLMPLLRYVSANETSMIPKRIVFVVEGNGIEPVNFLSPKAKARVDQFGAGPVGDLRNFHKKYVHTTPEIIASDDTLSQARTLSPLAAQPGLEGLEQDAAVVLGLSSLITGGGHSSVYGALGSMRSRGVVPAGQTIDSWLAAQSTVRGVGEEMNGRGRTPFEAFRAGIHQRMERQFVYGTSAHAQGNPAPVLIGAETAYSFLFSSIAQGSSGRAFTSQKKMLDHTHAQVSKSLNAFSGNSFERAKLERYIESIETLQARQSTLLLDHWQATMKNLPFEGPEDNTLFDSPHPLQRLELHFELAASALLGGLTNVVTIASGSGGGFDVNYTDLDLPASLRRDLPSRHGTHHLAYTSSDGIPGNSTALPWAEPLRQVTQRHVSLIAKLARTLKATAEIDGSTMLDHTLIVYMPDNGETHHASGAEWPMLLVGGQKMGFKTTGRTVIYPGVSQDGNRQVSNLYHSIAHAVNAPLNGFGEEGELVQDGGRRKAYGPLSELWAPP